MMGPFAPSFCPGYPQAGPNKSVTEQHGTGPSAPRHFPVTALSLRKRPSTARRPHAQGRCAHTKLRAERGKHIEEIQSRLRALNIFQYLFPPPDQLALGAAERGITKRSEITEIVASAPSLGHPYGTNELIPSADAVLEVVDLLTERRKEVSPFFAIVR
jgi:hypothetical protein